MRLPIMARDASAQRRNAERRGVTDVTRIERGPRGRDRGARRGRGWLADLHVHDTPARRFDAGCRRHHVHHHEGRNVAARGRGDQVARDIQHDLRLLLTAQTVSSPRSRRNRRLLLHRRAAERDRPRVDPSRPGA